METRLVSEENIVLYEELGDLDQEIEDMLMRYYKDNPSRNRLTLNFLFFSVILLTTITINGVIMKKLDIFLGLFLSLATFYAHANQGMPPTEIESGVSSTDTRSWRYTMGLVCPIPKL
jgi:hypothetical protein